MKAYTDINQSKRLAEILPLESADMRYERVCFDRPPEKCWYVKLSPPFKSDDIIPCWSLAALLEKLPYEVVDEEGTSRFFELYRGYMDEYYISYTGADEDIEGEYYDNFVDACVEMILKLHELKML